MLRLYQFIEADDGIDVIVFDCRCHCWFNFNSGKLLYSTLVLNSATVSENWTGKWGICLNTKCVSDFNVLK